jgi:hypothetical protein
MKSIQSFKSIKVGLRLMLLAGVLVPAAQLSATTSPTAEEIMVKVDRMQRKSFSTQLASVQITTCRYTLVNGSVKCSERPRVVLAENAKKVLVAGDIYNYQELSVVREPISDKGTSLLVYEYGERGRDNDDWLYLPALAKVNRVIASDDDGGSVFGSEFSVETTENPEARKTYEYTYKILEETTYARRAVWVIEMLPTAEKARKTAYSRVVAWVDKEAYVPLKEDLYRGGRLYKQRAQSDVKQIDGVFVATKVVMNNLSTSRISEMDKLSMRHNMDIPEEFLTQRVLTDFAFRERNLAKFRAELNQ